MFGFGKRLDIYFIKDLIFRRAHEQLAESLQLTVEQDDYITKKTLYRITKNYEDCYNETIKLGKKEFKKIIKERKKRAKLGEIDQGEEIATFLQSIGVEFLELRQEEPEPEQSEEPEETRAEIDVETAEEEKPEQEDVEQEPEQEQGNQAE